MVDVTLKKNAVANIALLVANGHTQVELADLAGVSRVQMNRIVNGHSSPELDTCEALATSLGLPPIALLTDSKTFSKMMKKIMVTSS